MPYRLATALSLTLALAACSDSGEDPPDDAADAGAAPPGEIAAGYVIGGASCTSESTVPAGVAGAGELDAVESVDLTDTDTDTDADVGDGPGPCAASPTNLAPSGLVPTGTGTLAFDGRDVALGSAILVVEAAGDPGAADGFDLVLHDGETRTATSERDVDGVRTVGTAWAVHDASAALSIGLRPADAGDGPAGRLYDVANDASDLAAPGAEGVGIAIEPLLLIDLDGDGAFGFEELVEPASGQLVWAGTVEAPSLSFTFTLEDGRLVEGAYEGGYERVD